MAQGGPLFLDSLCLLMCKGYYSALKAVLLGRNLAPTLRHCVIDILYSLHELNCVEWLIWSSLVAQTVKRLPAMRETWVQFLGREDPLEKEMAIHFSTLAWKIPSMEEPDRLQSMGSQSWTRLSDFTVTFMAHMNIQQNYSCKEPHMECSQ